jgi:hypothetical protein
MRKNKTKNYKHRGGLHPIFFHQNDATRIQQNPSQSINHPLYLHIPEISWKNSHVTQKSGAKKDSSFKYIAENYQ